MAGDWIPMRLDLAEDPAVIAIADATGLDEYAVVGRLHRIWSWANKQLTDGIARQIGEAWIDRYVSAPGFTAALLKVGWLSIKNDCVTFPNFDRWNSQCAKKRVEKTRRKQVERSHKKGDTEATASDTIPRPLRKLVLDRDGNQCVNCGWKPGSPPAPGRLPHHDRLSIDHMIPQCQGGETVASNLVTLCLGCNQVKAGRTFEDAGMSPDLSHISGDKTATEMRPEKRREENKEEDPPNPPSGGMVSVPSPGKPRRTKPGPETVPVPAVLDAPDFRAAWADWLADRRERRKTVTPRAAELQLRKLAPLGAPTAVEWIRNAIAQGWTGLYAPAVPRAAAQNDYAKRTGLAAMGFPTDSRS